MARQTSVMQPEERRAYDWAILNHLRPEFAAADAARADARQAESGQTVQENHHAGQDMNEDHDSVEPEPVIHDLHLFPLQVRLHAVDKHQGR